MISSLIKRQVQPCHLTRDSNDDTIVTCKEHGIFHCLSRELHHEKHSKALVGTVDWKKWTSKCKEIMQQKVIVLVSRYNIKFTHVNARHASRTNPRHEYMAKSKK